MTGLRDAHYCRGATPVTTVRLRHRHGPEYGRCDGNCCYDCGYCYVNYDYRHCGYGYVNGNYELLMLLLATLLLRLLLVLVLLRQLPLVTTATATTTATTAATARALQQRRLRPRQLPLLQQLQLRYCYLSLNNRGVSFHDSVLLYKTPPRSQRTATCYCHCCYGY